MRNRVILLAILLYFCNIIGLVLGQDPSRHPTDPRAAGTARFGDASSIARVYQDYLYGVVKQIGKDELVLSKTKFGIDQSFKLVPKTKFVFDGKRTSPDQLKIGDQVWVDLKTNKKTGEMVALEVVWGVLGTNAKGKAPE